MRTSQVHADEGFIQNSTQVVKSLLNFKDNFLLGWLKTDLARVDQVYTGGAILALTDTDYFYSTDTDYVYLLRWLKQI